jgi:hypothetical protein
LACGALGAELLERLKGRERLLERRFLPVPGAQRPCERHARVRCLERHRSPLVEIDGILERAPSGVGFASRVRDPTRREALGRAQRYGADRVRDCRKLVVRALAPIEITEPEPDRHEQLERGGRLDRLVAAEAAHVLLRVAERGRGVVVVERDRCANEVG